ncbi:MAG: hypothetical protein WD669_08800 [Pirellulales bacterium]
MLAALAGKNATLNAVLGYDSSTVFQLGTFLVGDDEDFYVAGVESDAADGTVDGQHDYHLIDNSGTPFIATSYPTTVVSNALQVSHKGSNTGVNGMVASGKSVLFGPGLTEGLGPTTDTQRTYRAQSIPFQFEDISNDGTSVASGASIALPFPTDNRFEFFDQENIQQVFVHDNGTITFADVSSFPGNTDLSTATAESLDFPLIAPLWGELLRDPDNPTTSTILSKSVDVDGDFSPELVVQWNNFHYGDSVFSVLYSTDPITFQVVLYANGNIGFNYQDLDVPTDAANPAAPAITGGIAATVGIWNGAPTPVTIPAGRFVPGLNSINGAYDELQSESNDSYIRLAWDSGGSAWDSGAPAIKFVAFADSLAAQIIRQHEDGKVFHNDSVLAAIDFGEDEALQGFGRDDITSSSNWSDTTLDIDTTSNSIPLIPGTSTKASQVFKTVTKSTSASTDLDLSITTTATGATLANGTYVVELMFSPVLSGTSKFDVLLEGKLFLDNYDPAADFARIATQPGDSSVLESRLPTAATPFTTIAGIVKRFEVNVTGGNGLQIKLDAVSGATAAPSIAGARILREAPAVADVLVYGSSWTRAPYSYAQLTEAGGQLKPIFTQGVNRIQVVFTEHVVKNEDGDELTSSDFKLWGSDADDAYATGHNTVEEIPQNTSVFDYDEAKRTATLVFDNSLPRDKYRLEVLGTIRDTADNTLDGEWNNLLGNSTPDNFADDAGRPFVMGNGAPGGAFSLFFSLLPGDYNQDGEASSGDYTVWQNSPSNGPADGNGDNIVSSADFDVWDDNYGNSIPTRARFGELTNRGDYNDDEIVTKDDYLVWKGSYGQTGANLPADGNFDGTVNAADYTIYRNNSGDESAWFGTSSSSGTAVVEVIFNAAPRVINVTVSGSESTHDPFSFNGANDATDFDGSGIQLRTVPVGGADTISIKFNEDVNVTSNMLKLTGLYTADVPTLEAFSYDLGTQTATWRFETIIHGDHYLIALSDAVTDVDGDTLDGEWTNPTTITTTNAAISEFPSGNGTEGGDFNFVVTLLPGDADLDNISDFSDFTTLVTYYGEDEVEFIQADFDGDGVVGSDDYDLLVQNYGVTLTTVHILSDLNNDNCVDSLDMQIMWANFQENLPEPTEDEGDLDDDDDIDSDDYDLLMLQYGIIIVLVS